MIQPRNLARLQALDWRFSSFILLHLLVFRCWCGESALSLARREWTVDGSKREALVCAPSPAKQEPTPVIFVFHGHGGNMEGAARNFHYHRLWPDAIVMYMQGLSTPGRLTDPAGRLPGWQAGLGQEGDRDLKFFDAVLAWSFVPAHRRIPSFWNLAEVKNQEPVQELPQLLNLRGTHL